MKRIIKALIYLYREGISRYTQPRCIYIPTCSSYALEAVWRILRCNPFSKGGYDPVPEYFTFRREYLVYCKKNKKDKRR
jgi:hypothetical protein